MEVLRGVYVINVYVAEMMGRKSKGDILKNVGYRPFSVTNMLHNIFFCVLQVMNDDRLVILG